MSKEYETIIFIPIIYTDFPESKQLINKPENSLELKVKSHGFYLLSNNLFKTKTLTISVKDLAEVKANNYSQKHWVVKRNYKKINKHLASDIRILSVNPDTLFIRFQQKESKKVPIVFNGELDFLAQIRLKDKINIFPDSIFVFGTKENLSEIEFVKTKSIVFNKVEKSTKQEVELSEIEGISFTNKKVKISFEVEKFTEKIIEIPLSSKNVPEGYKIKFYPSKVEIVTTVAFAYYDKLISSLFLAEVDASDLNGEKRLDVVLSKHPSFANILKVKPSRVEFLLIREK